MYKADGDELHVKPLALPQGECSILIRDDDLPFKERKGILNSG